MKKIFLEKLIYQNYLKTSLASILFIELVLIIIYFTVNSNMINSSVNFILKDIERHTYDLVQSETKSIEKKFSEIEVFAKLLQNEHQNFFENPQDYRFKTEPVFKVANNGMYYKQNNNGGSSVVVSNKTEITPLVYKKLRNSEVFDNTFKSIVEYHKDIVAVYFNSFDDINRYYPYIPNVYNAFASDIHMEDYNFYYEADLKHNPNKDVKWTDLYLDPAGQGWLLSAIVPIYNNNFLEGVTGIDVTIDSFIANFLNIKLPHNGKSFILNKNGKIVAMPKEIEEILDIKEVSKYDYESSDAIKTTIYKSSKFDILKYKDSSVSKSFNNILTDKKYDRIIKINDEEYLIYTKKIEKTSWTIVSLIPKVEVLKEVRKLEDNYKCLGYVIIAFIIIFYIIFFIFLSKKAKELVSKINTPLLEIIEVTKNLARSTHTKELESCGIKEIDELNKNFNELSHELDSRTKELIKAETQKEINEKLANTDALTGAYNRRFLQDFSDKYIQIAKREKHNFSIILADIDDFKLINDTYGHHVGDEIIQSFVDIVKKTIRENDIIIRYGGDEFVILLPNTNFSDTKIVAKKIIDELKVFNQKESLYFTTSMGISEIEEDDTTIDSLIKRADEALYTAKKLGKNCIV